MPDTDNSLWKSLQNKYPSDILAQASNIQLLVLDVDGVLTDGGLIHGDDSLQYKRFSSRDGHGLRMLQEAGIVVAIITGRTSKVVADRAQELGIEKVYQGYREKLGAYQELCQDLKLDASQTAFMGDDVIDLPPMLRAGLGLTVADAHDLVLAHADWVSSRAGGFGAVRDACELLLHAHGKLQPALQQYLQ